MDAAVSLRVAGRRVIAIDRAVRRRVSEWQRRREWNGRDWGEAQGRTAAIRMRIRIDGTKRAGAATTATTQHARVQVRAAAIRRESACTVCFATRPSSALCARSVSAASPTVHWPLTTPSQLIRAAPICVTRSPRSRSSNFAYLAGAHNGGLAPGRLLSNVLTNEGSGRMDDQWRKLSHLGWAWAMISSPPSRRALIDLTLSAEQGAHCTGGSAARLSLLGSPPGFRRAFRDGAS